MWWWCSLVWLDDVAGCGRAEIVQLLLDAGAQHNVTDAEKQTPLQLCNQLKEHEWARVVDLLQRQ